ncbi:TetR/AcrR family transcriptional regulator [Aquirhabdus sp.]|uniref:TetR/AcrR family transcriptional regulator n=1 Tax=Aquirhabdus sp. TaxID=2824160 RepID=UPI00396CDC7D
MNKKTKQEDILETALLLFSEHGYHAVGIDRIIAEAKIAKMTLYKYFPSKELLIESVLLKRDSLLRASILDAVNKAQDPIHKLKAIFDWYEVWFKSIQFHGCMFIRASEEFPDAKSNIRTISQNHKMWLTELMQESLEEIGVESPLEVASHLLVILDGLTVKLTMFDSPVVNQTEIAWKYTKQVIESSVALPS